MTDSDEIQIVERDDHAPHRPACPTDSSQYETLYGNNFPRDTGFQRLVWETEMAIATGVSPELSAKGTSGCYFVKDRNAVSSLTEGICQSHHLDSPRNSWSYLLMLYIDLSQSYCFEYLSVGEK